MPVATFLANLLPWWRFTVPMVTVVASVALFVAPAITLDEAAFAHLKRPRLTRRPGRGARIGIPAEITAHRLVGEGLEDIGIEIRTCFLDQPFAELLAQQAPFQFLDVALRQLSELERPDSPIRVSLSGPELMPAPPGRGASRRSGA